MWGEAPPCERCPGPPQIPPALDGTWALWREAHAGGRDGMTGRLMLGPLVALAQALDATREDLEGALELERRVWPAIRPKEER